MASYNSLIPIGTDAMLKSQSQIKANFQAINSVFARNHAVLNSALQGMHNVVTFRKQAGDATTGATQIALYSKEIASVTNLFFRPSANQTPIQLTYQEITTGLLSEDPDIYLTAQQTFLAGPFVVYAGSIAGVANGAIITLLPASTLIYVGLTAKTPPFVSPTSNFTMCTTNIAANQFTVGMANAISPQDLYYLAIGV